MTEEGVNGLSLAEVARRLGVQPPSLYKYFPSLMAIYDAIFLRGQIDNLAELRRGMAGAEPGLPALIAGLEASGAGCWPTVPWPSCCSGARCRASSPRRRRSRRAWRWSTCSAAPLADAVAAGQLGPDGQREDAVYLVSILIVGVLSQAIANEPGLPWGEGRFTPTLRPPDAPAARRVPAGLTASSRCGVFAHRIGLRHRQLAVRCSFDRRLRPGRVPSCGREGAVVRRHRIAGPVAFMAAGVMWLGLAVAVSPTTASAGTPVPGAPNCPMFPADNVWNTPIAGLPVNPNSAAWMASMDAATTNLHPDFGPSGDPSNPYGMPYTVVVPVTARGARHVPVRRRE